MNPILLKTILVLISFALGGALTFGVMKLTEGSSGDDDTSSSANGTRVTDSLQYITVMSRHGNRASSVNYPMDPYPLSDATFWPYGINQLTNVGRQQEYNLGKRLRTLYNGFLNTTYSQDNIMSKSDIVPRCVLSGQMILEGLFPPESFEKWNSNNDWQPVVLFTNSTDHAYNIDSNCARFAADKANAYSHFEQENAANISELVQYFYNYSQVTYDANNLSSIFEKIYSEDTEGLTLPSELSGVYPEPFADFYTKNFVTRMAGTQEMARLLIGDMYEEALDWMKAKINGSAPDQKMNYYSAHDCSIISLQLALGIARQSIIGWVKVGSALVIELHEESDSGEYYIEVIFIDGSSMDSEPVSLSVHGCGEPCYFDVLVNTTTAFTNLNYEEECLATPTTTTLKDFRNF